MTKMILRGFVLTLKEAQGIVDLLEPLITSNRHSFITARTPLIWRTAIMNLYMNVYTYRFNPFNRYWEIIENIRELESYRVIRSCKNEQEAKELVRYYWQMYENVVREIETIN